MPSYGKRRTYRKGSIAARGAARRAYGNANTGYPRMGARRMQGPPAALYSRVPTNATAIKSCDSTSSGAIQSTTAPAVLIVPLLGSAFFNRLSNRTRAVSLQLDGYFYPTTTNAAALTQQYARVIIYYDRQSNGANPSQATLLLDTTATGTTGTGVLSHVNINNRDRFMILRDRKVILPAIGINGGTTAEDAGFFTDVNMTKAGIKYTEFIKLKGLESLYNSTNGGTIGDISAGAFGLLVFNGDGSGSPAWGFALQTRFKFLD